LMYTMDPSSNWGIGGVALRHGFLEQSETTPLSLAGRATYEHLIGPDEVNVDGAALESLVSHRFGVLSPFAGVGVTGSLGSEQAVAPRSPRRGHAEAGPDPGAPRQGTCRRRGSLAEVPGNAPERSRLPADVSQRRAGCKHKVGFWTLPLQGGGGECARTVRS